VIRLFTTAFPVRDELRRREFAECLDRNLACDAIDGVFVLAEAGATLPSVRKLRVKEVPVRPLYDDFFAWMAELAGPDDVSMIANADIAFEDAAIAVLDKWRIPEGTAIALSRWDTPPRGPAVLNDRNDSQDSWIFRGPVRPGLRGDFPVGAVRCDNRLARELELAGYSVINPAFSIRSFHVHAGGARDYDVAHQPHFVPPPYAYVWPHNLWSLPRTLAHNVSHPAARVAWRFDSRRVRSALKLHRLGKVMRIALGRERM
jgi:hypothetical protein